MVAEGVLVKDPAAQAWQTALAVVVQEDAMYCPAVQVVQVTQADRPVTEA